MAASKNLTSGQRQTRSRQASHASWANTDDRTQRTAPGRAGMLRKFEDQVDPDRVLSPAERAKRVESARKAFYTGLALKSAKVRAAKRAAVEP